MTDHAEIVAASIAAMIIVAYAVLLIVLMRGI